MSKLNYREDILIDRFNLEVEWESHTHKFINYMEQEVEAQDIRDQLERRLELVRAEMDDLIRSKPGKYGIEKVSETAIKSAIIKSKQYREAEGEYLKALKRTRLLSGVMKAMEHRKRALSDLTSLQISGYYSGSRPSTDGISDSRQERQRQALKEKMEKKNRRS